jgi:hypothetical protein
MLVSLASPALKIGTIFAILSLEGTTPVAKDCVKMCASGVIRECLTFLIKLAGLRSRNRNRNRIYLETLEPEPYSEYGSGSEYKKMKQTTPKN